MGEGAGGGGPGRRKGADAGAIRATFAPVTESSSSDGAGGAWSPWRQLAPAEALAGAPGNPWLLPGRSPEGPAPSSGSQCPVSAPTPGPTRFLALRSIYILIKSGFKPPGRLA